jgi:hypothetical protein
MFALLLAAPLAAFAQTTTQNVEVEPVTCWWRANAAVVTVGQPFTIVLTCSVLETDAARAVVERTRMGAAAVQFPPYEVVGGTQSPDHVTAGRRFMQYEYTARLIAEDAFGTDVPINGMEISYRLESRVQQDGAVQGREQAYVLPPLPMRVASLVADDARQIREPRVPTFAEIATREFRARMFRLVALILFGIAALTLVLALVRLARQRRTGTPDADTQLLGNRAVLAGVRRELLAVRDETRRGGWTPELIARALAAARVLASYMTGRVVVQRSVARDASIGELSLARAWPVRRRVAVSGATTAGTLNAARVGNTEIAASDLDTALTQFTVARYGRATTIDSAALDEALDTAIRAADRVASRFTRRAEASASMRESVRGWRPRAWAR